MSNTGSAENIDKFKILLLVESLRFVSAVHCFDNSYVGKQPVAWKEYCVEYWFKEIQESMDRYTGCHDITEILLKMVLNGFQSINQSKFAFIYSQK